MRTVRLNTHKYGAVPSVSADGRRFASKKEMARYQQLLLLERVGEIRDLELQPRFTLKVNGVKVCTYVADFRFMERQADGVAWVQVVEDAKGFRTDVYLLKKKLMKAIHGIEIRET